MTIGENIKKYRNLRGLKQSELAQMSGISRVAIGNYERGDRTPNVNILLKIANALDVSLYELSSIKPSPSIESNINLNDSKTKKMLDRILNNSNDGDIFNGSIDPLSPEEVNRLKQAHEVAILSKLNKLDKTPISKYIDDNKTEICKSIFNSFGYQVEFSTDNKVFIHDNNHIYKKIEVNSGIFYDLSKNIYWALESFIDKFIDDNTSVYIGDDE